MTPIVFIVGKQYSRKDIYELLGVPSDKRRGNWETGYTRYNDEYYIFVNIESPGRSGHNYNDKWLDDGSLFWHGKLGSHLNQPGIINMLNPDTKCHFFTRSDNRNTYFTYQGVGRMKAVQDVTPVEVTWEFAQSGELPPEFLPSKVHITPSARNACISHYGAKCFVCGFNFEEIYGTLGEGYIHVSVNSPSTTKVDDPIHDLRPVCSNCRSMLQRRPGARLSIDMLKEAIAPGKV